jgi:hypothetical protein
MHDTLWFTSHSIKPASSNTITSRKFANECEGDSILENGHCQNKNKLFIAQYFMADNPGKKDNN